MDQAYWQGIHWWLFGKVWCSVCAIQNKMGLVINETWEISLSVIFIIAILWENQF